MKLYTEYNLKEVYFKGLYNGQNHIEGECHNAIDSQTPIELPTKEQIDDFAFRILHFAFYARPLFSFAPLRLCVSRFVPETVGLAWSKSFTFRCRLNRRWAIAPTATRIAFASWMN